MVQAAGVGHALDHILGVAGNVHLHASRNAHAARPLGRVIDPRQCVLQARIAGHEGPPPDEVARDIHADLLFPG